MHNSHYSSRLWKTGKEVSNSAKPESEISRASAIAFCSVRRALWAGWDVISDFCFQFSACSFPNLFLFNCVLILSKPTASELLCFLFHEIGLQIEHVRVPLWQTSKKVSPDLWQNVCPHRKKT